MTIAALVAENNVCWAKAQIVPSRLAEVNAVAAKLCAVPAKAIYQQISTATGVPWWVIAIIHEREASQNFNCGIAQGDPWNAISTHVPRGIGPFKSFVEAAVFALTRCAPYAAKWADWTAGGALTLFVLYNGTGYEDFHHEVSPYDWGATTMEQEGKYVADGQWSATVWDTQIGCAAMLKAMMAIDPSIQFGTPKPVAVAPPPFRTPSQAALAAGFTAARARINTIAGSWSSWISDDAVRQVVSDTVIAAHKADG
jgi:lysozyme family protein